MKQNLDAWCGQVGVIAVVAMPMKFHWIRPGGGLCFGELTALDPAAPSVVSEVRCRERARNPIEQSVLSSSTATGGPVSTINPKILLASPYFNFASS